MNYSNIAGNNRSNASQASFTLSGADSDMEYEPTSSTNLKRQENFFPRQMNEWGFFVDCVDSC